MTLTCSNQLRMHLLQHAAWLGALTTTIQQNIDEGLVSASDIYVTKQYCWQSSTALTAKTCKWHNVVPWSVVN